MYSQKQQMLKYIIHTYLYIQRRNSMLRNNGSMKTIAYFLAIVTNKAK